MCIGTIRLICHVLAELHKKILYLCLYLYLMYYKKNRLITALTRGLFSVWLSFQTG